MLQPAQGSRGLILELILIVVSILLMMGGVVLLSSSLLFGLLAIVVGPVPPIADLSMLAGLKSVRPNEALVLTLFGSYHGTVKAQASTSNEPLCSAVSPAYDKAAAGGAMKKGKRGGGARRRRLHAGRSVRQKARVAQDDDAGQRQAEGERRALGNPHHNRRGGHLAQ